MMIFVGLAGILLGDSIIFRAGQTMGERLLETRLGKHIPGERVQRTIHLFERHGAKFIMVARFLPGVRAVTYFVAGTTGVSFWKFLLYDGIAACASAPAWVLLGYWAGRHRMLQKAWRMASHVQLGILAVVLGAVVTWVVTLAVLRRRKKARSRAALSQPPPSLSETPAPPLQAIDGGRSGGR